VVRQQKSKPASVVSPVIHNHDGCDSRLPLLQKESWDKPKSIYPEETEWGNVAMVQTIVMAMRSIWDDSIWKSWCARMELFALQMRRFYYLLWTLPVS
jgi:hypothetical protein